MSKNYFGGAIINSGPDLPNAVTTPEGTLFLKTGTSPGLYFYGFNPDTSGSFGNQAALGWNLLVDTSGVAPYVLKVGDTMTGNLVGTSFRAAAGAPNAGDASTNGFAISTDGDSGLFGVASTSVSLYLNGTERFQVTAAGLFTAGNEIWHAGNDGASSGLDAGLLGGAPPADYNNMASVNKTGILPYQRGGTGTGVAPAAGAVPYGTGTTLGYALGTAGQVLLSAGTGAPTWTNQSSLSVGFATSANTANSATTALSATNADKLVTAVINDFNIFNNGTGAYRSQSSVSSNIPYSVNFTLWQSDYSPTAGSQIAIPASNSGVDQRMFFRGGTGSAYAAWAEVITTGNLASLGGTSFVLKAGDTMTGSLGTTALAVGAISLPGVGSANFAANLTALGFVSAAGNVNSTGASVTAMSGNVIGGGYVQAGDSASASGVVRIQSSGSANSGNIEFIPGNDVRAGYIGNAASVGSIDTGTLAYIGALHAFTGNMTVTGTITAQGNVIAYSDAKLKTNVDVIHHAMERVQQIRGVTYSRVDDPAMRRQTGVIAQEVMAVLPEAIFESEDGTLGVAYGNMVGLLIEAIKEQQDEINELKALVHKVLTRFA